MNVKHIRTGMEKNAKKAAEKLGAFYGSGRERISQVELRPLWERVKVGFERTANAVGKGTGKAAESVALTAKRAGIRYERFELNRKLQRLVARLGAAVYDGRLTNARSISYSAQPVKGLIEEISGVEKQLDDLDRRERSLKKAA